MRRAASPSTVDAMPPGDSEGATVWWPSRHKGETLDQEVRKTHSVAHPKRGFYEQGKVSNSGFVCGDDVGAGRVGPKPGPEL